MNNLKIIKSVCMKNVHFPIKLLKCGFGANVKCRKEPVLACCMTFKKKKCWERNMAASVIPAS